MKNQTVKKFLEPVTTDFSIKINDKIVKGSTKEFNDLEVISVKIHHKIIDITAV